MEQIIDKNIDYIKIQLLYRFLEILEELNNSNDKIIIWVSWWSSIDFFYQLLKDNPTSISQEIWNKINFVFVDERIVSLDDKDSNFLAVYNKLFQDLIKWWFIKENQIIKINPDTNDIAQDYSSKVNKIHIWLLWVWEDGHTCSLFPHHKLLNEEDKKYLLITDSPKPPKDRITISKTMLKNIDYAFVFFIWEGKKKAFEKILDPSITPNDLPIKYALESKNPIIISNIDIFI